MTSSNSAPTTQHALNDVIASALERAGVDPKRIAEDSAFWKRLATEGTDSPAAEETHLVDEIERTLSRAAAMLDVLSDALASDGPSLSKDVLGEYAEALFDHIQRARNAFTEYHRTLAKCAALGPAVPSGMRKSGAEPGSNSPVVGTPPRPYRGCGCFLTAAGSEVSISFGRVGAFCITAAPLRRQHDKRNFASRARRPLRHRAQKKYVP